MEALVVALGLLSGAVAAFQIVVWVRQGSKSPRRPDWTRRRRSDRQLAEFVAPGKPPIYLETYVQESDGRTIVRGVGGRWGSAPPSLLQKTGWTLAAPYEGYRFNRLCPDFGQPTVALPDPGLITTALR